WRTAHERKTAEAASVRDRHPADPSRHARILLGLRALFSPGPRLAASPASPRRTEPAHSLVPPTTGPRLVHPDVVHRRLPGGTFRNRPRLLCGLSQQTQATGHDPRRIRKRFGTLAAGRAADLGGRCPPTNPAASGRAAAHRWFFHPGLRWDAPG